VTVEDVFNAEKIFGPDVASLKGKTARSKAAIVRNDEIVVPPELKTQCTNLTLYIDIMFVNGMPMLTRVDDLIRHRACVPMKSQHADQLYSGLDEILRFYNKHGYLVKRIRADNEFRVMLQPIQDNLDVEIELANVGDHVPQAERNNRFLGERFRACYHNLPCNVLRI
jgi:hypothetical protein